MANKMKQQLRPNAPAESAGPAALNNQDGSVIVMVLMILAIMTVIGIVSSNTVITENYMVRNMGIRKQNVSLVESALMQGLQEFMQLDNSNPNNFNPALNTWINDRTITTAGAPEALINTIWYQNTFTQPCLAANNSRSNANLPLLATRGEGPAINLRYAVVGWQPVNLGTTGGSTSLVVGTGAVWREGRILAEYVSMDGVGNGNGFGLIRQELGVKQQW